MFELLFTSFPVIIRYYFLRRRGETMTVSNMKTAVFLWLSLAFALFLAIFYYHPKSYTGIVPFLTVSVVAQTSGPVTEVLVQNGQRVKKGDLLFQIENDTQTAALAKALTAFQNLDATEAKANSAVEVARANVSQSNAARESVREKLKDAEELLRKKVGRANTVISLRLSLQEAQSTVEAAQAQLKAAETEITDVIPAARISAEAEHQAAEVALAKTEVRAPSSGAVTQMVLSVGSPASQLILAPAMVIIPDRDKNQTTRITAGFSQVANGTLHVGMPAEIACDANAKITMKNAVMAARLVSIQHAIAIGQISPSGTLIEPDSLAQRGSLLVGFELVHEKHQAMLVDGSGCIVQTYTDNLSGTFGHIIAATGVIKALLLRIKAWGALIAGVGLAGDSH
jgi:multidrug resistance efflux pump